MFLLRSLPAAARSSWVRAGALQTLPAYTARTSFASMPIPTEPVSQFGSGSVFRVPAGSFHSLSSVGMSALTAAPPTPLAAPLQREPLEKFEAPTVDVFLNENGRVALYSALFRGPIRVDILQRVVVWYRASIRAGLACAKTRAEVVLSTKKTRRQKGTGRARMSTRKAPHFRGGGVAFPPKPRDFSYALPKSVKRYGMRVALATKHAQNNLIVLGDLALREPFTKAKDARKLLEAAPLAGKRLLYVLPEECAEADSFVRVMGNFPAVSVQRGLRSLTAYHVIQADVVLLHASLLPTLSEMYVEELRMQA